MKVLELKEKAKSLGIKGYYKMKKQELLDAILNAEQEEPLSPIKEEPFGYYTELKTKHTTIRIDIDTENIQEATRQFFKIGKENPKFPLLELYCNGRKIRQRRQ